MRLAKFGHSCLLVETGSGARLLVDPGVLSTVPDEIVSGPLDAILITHLHPDHLDIELVGRIEAAHAGLPIFASSDIVAVLAEKGIGALDHPFEPHEIAGARIEAMEAGHDAILTVAPPNTAYRIDGELVITGDSTSVALDAWAGTRALALPTSAPWATRPHLANLVERLKPQTVFPVHDGYLIATFLAWQDDAYAQYLSERDVQYVKLGSELIEI